MLLIQITMLYSSVVCRLKTQHQALPEIIRRLDEAKLSQQPESGKWSIKDNIAHLVSYQPVFLGRMSQILKGDNPAFSAYRADDEPDFVKAQSLPLTALLDQLAGNRRQILELITNLPDDQLSLKGTHPKYGTLNIVEWTEFFLLHEAHHLFAIFKLAKELSQNLSEKYAGKLPADAAKKLKDYIKQNRAEWDM
jgi:uncharacterized damage-inducible protein DinB